MSRQDRIYIVLCVLVVVVAVIATLVLLGPQISIGPDNIRNNL